MHMQPFQPQDGAVAHPDRIHVPPAPGALAFSPTPPPSLLSVFAREAWKRKPLLGFWVVATLVLTALVVLVFAKPVYRAEGKFSYRPNYSRGQKPIYTPPNIQSAAQILKSNEVLTPVRMKHLPNVSADEFAKNVRVEVSKQSEFIDVGYDHPNPAIAAAVANDLMAEGLKHFADVRVQNMKDAIVQVTHDLKTARKQLENAREEYRKAHEQRGVADLDVEHENLRLSLSSIESQFLAAREKQAKLKLEIKFLEVRLDAPANANDPVFDDQFFPILQAMMTELQSKMIDQEKLNAARIHLDLARRKESDYRPLMMKGILPRKEYDEVVAEIRIHEATLKHAEEVKHLRTELQKKYDDLTKKATASKPIRRNVLDELEKARKEEAILPATLAVLEDEQKAKRRAISDLVSLRRELSEKDDNIKLNLTRVQDFHAQLTDAAERSQDLNANDLRMHSAAEAGTTPYSTNAPKLGLALVGASALLFVGYIALFALPMLSASSGASPVGTVANRLPRGLVALVPYIQKPRATTAESPDPEPPFADAVSQPGGVIEALAARISREGVDPGGIVLFAPTMEELAVAPVMGDLGEMFTRNGEKVLVFDARQSATAPQWAGPAGNDIAATVEGFLDGQADASTGCFTPTMLNGVEYSRADLSTRVTGVMAAHRFRQLVEEMRERYSMVLLVTPPVSFDSEPLLATLAEGMVLVTETSADPMEVHAYLDTLCQQVSARLYGTLSVPKA
jgi:uncharacterized protein involved in exopolysaccharide biosynthesis